MKFIYKGNQPTLTVLNGSLVSVSQNQIVDLPKAPSSDFILYKEDSVEEKEEAVQEVKQTPVLKKKAGRPRKSKVLADGIETETSGLGQ